MIRAIFSTLLSLFFLNVTYSQNRIIADISNFKNDKGVCLACLFNNSSSFEKNGQPFQCVSVPIRSLRTVAIFNNIPVGSYAMFVFHDANSNKRMDKNFIGIPKEGYGASKNKLPFASAPSFDENEFVIENNATVRLAIKIRNL